MKQLKNFLIKREQSQARLSFAKREKSRLLAKTLLTLVALLALTTGAWAQTETLLTTITNTGENASFKSGNKTFDNIATVTFSGEVVNDGDNWGWFFNQESDKTITVTAASDAYTITRVKFYCADGSAFDEEAPFEAIVRFEDGYIAKVNGTSIGHWGVNKIEVYGYETPAPSSSSGLEVAWTAATKTGTFTMPGDNVIVSVEYYDQATLADKGLTAAVDAAAKTEAPLAVLAENAITGGTVMYYVAPDANFSQADAIALAETAWSADIPTAETIDAAGGTCYVWYYIKGDDEHSDTDPQRLTVTVLPEPTYAVELAEGTEESDKWTVKAGTDGSFQSLPLKGVKAGTKVKLKYDGDRSMLKAVTAVKAEKKAAEEPVADIVWDGTNVTDIIISGSGESSYEKGGITLSDNGEQKYAMWNDYGDPTMSGISFSTNASGGFTFTAPTGKAFTKIEMTVNGTGGWQSANLGTGWAFNADMDKQIFTVTWKGSATSTVKLLTDADAFGGDTVTSIAFYLSE